MRPDRHFDWHRIGSAGREAPNVVDSLRRARLCLALFAALLLLVLGRVVQLEIGHGAAFRAEAARPLVRRESIPGVRGRILARDGTVLACDKQVLAVAVHYRWLEEPADASWLRRTARSRLSASERRDSRRVAAEEARVWEERDDATRRLADLCGLSAEEWKHRAQRIQARVERIAGNVNRQRQAHSGRPPRGNGPPRRPADEPSGSLLGRIGSYVVDALRESMDEPSARWITVAEELDYHVVVEDVPLATVAEIESHPERYPCLKIIDRRQRSYPAGRLAAHVLGHLGRVGPEDIEADSETAEYHPDDRLGRTGLERQYESLLRGRRGVAEELTDRSGRVLSSRRIREPGVGRDLIVTLDPPLQRAATRLLAGALDRRAMLDPEGPPSGGAIVVMEIHSGQLLTVASAPDFDPNLFAGGNGAELEALLSDPADPLFPRAIKMAIPPGSVFKTVSAVALLEASRLDPDAAFTCRGYLHDPSRQRCAVYTRRGVGHGELTLSDALSESCNVYFFHHAGPLGLGPLVDWAWRFGFGRTTGVDLPGEASGRLPTPATLRRLEGRGWHTADTRALAIGQSALEVTPLQIVRMMAAVANGGRLVTPHLVRGLGLPSLDDGQSTAALERLAQDPIRFPPPQPIAGLQSATLATIREALERVVCDPHGTAHGTVYLDSIRVAGKTGTAQTGGGRNDHAWFAGYVPADEPSVAFVVVLEHAGDAAETAGPVANRLVREMQRLGYFDKHPGLTARR
ncbi:MAG: penicillin-binding transpeptidase domain-containing protein [Planctomycetota bacterium]|jgi:penicillin-binding protein 2